ncbi:MAG: hypothetical protein KDB03_22490 [Planctomycetales bacterium]|nr:hypothetical protein [Planctomycetales bacterium]
MAEFRIPGPTGLVEIPISDGTRMCRVSPSPGPVGANNNVVTAMPLEDRFVEVMRRTLPLLPADIQEEFAAMFSPSALLIMAGTLAVWAGSHYVGIGFIVDGLLLLGGVVFLGWQIWSAASDFMSFIDLTYNARSSSDLDTAAKHLSNFIAVVGVAAFIALVTKGAAKRVNLAKAAATRILVRMATAVEAGMTPNHFQSILKVAMNPKNPRIILFRKTNPKSVQYIERGFPPKPKEIKVKTGEHSGIVTATDPGEISKVRTTVDPNSGKKYYTVDSNGRTATNGDGLTIDLDVNQWPVETGQVIDPTSKKPLVGDYDLFDVFDPQVLAGNKPPNQGNLVLATSDGKFVDDFTNPEVRQVVSDLNDAIGSRRVMHGHHAAYDSIENLKPDELISVFMPDGNVFSMNKEALLQFYKKIGRSTLDLSNWMQ